MFDSRVGEGGRVPDSFLAKSWDKQDRPAALSYQDVWALVLFVANIGIVWLLALEELQYPHYGDVVDTFIENTPRAMLVGFVLSLAWLRFILHHPKIFFKAVLGMSIFMNLGIVFVGACITLMLQPVVYSVVCGTFVALWVLFVSWLFFAVGDIWHRIEFASVHLKVACSAVYDHVSVVLVGMLLLVVQIFWCYLCLLGHFSFFLRQTGGLASFALLAVSFFWGLMVVKNIVHVTVCGTVGSWWFQQNPSSPIAGSLRRATTTSLGSICLGSLIAPFTDHGRWAYTYVALYGTSFTSSGSSVMRLFRDRGWATVINDKLISYAMLFGALLVAFVSGIVGLALAVFVQKVEFLEFFFSYVPPVFTVGLAVTLVFVTVVDSAVATVFVCFAEDPDALLTTHPEHHMALVRIWKRLHPDYLKPAV